MERGKHYMKKQRGLSRYLSVLLCAVMLLGLIIPVTAFAVESNQDNAIVHSLEECSDACAVEGCECSCHAQGEEAAEPETEESEAPQEEPLPQEGEDDSEEEVPAADTAEEPADEDTEDFDLITVPFTKAAALDHEAVRGASDANADNPGVETVKTTTPNGDGTYTIRLESWVTGSTTTTTTTIVSPLDIVLVLDQSGSMAYDFNGNSTGSNPNRRQYAMKQAVNNFIDAVAENFDANTADHRMAIVTFGSNASNLRGWTYVNTTGKNNLKGDINELPNSPSGATNAGAGMNNAKNLMTSDYTYYGSNTAARQKVVIVFTDGVPTDSSRFSDPVANTALGHANTLKNDGAAVYTVGVFNGANVNQLYGSTGFDQNANGTVGSHWSNYMGIFTGDVYDVDVPAGNRFLNYLSSNFQGVTSIGLKDYDHRIAAWGQLGWEITANASRTTSGFYLTANDAASLNNVFQSISTSIIEGGATITLDSTTVVQDTVSEFFQLPEGMEAADILVKTADCTSFSGDTPVWTNEHAVDLTPTVNGNTVTVTGFDFSANWVGKNTTTGVVNPGKKLILEFTVVPLEGLLGGNGIPSNIGSTSFIMSGDEIIENFTTPVTDVPINDVQIGEVGVGVPDVNVYLLSNLTAEQLKAGVTATCGDVELQLTQENCGLADWQCAYVDITVDFRDGNNNPLADMTALTDDTTYSATVTIAPKAEGTVTAKTDTDTGDILVFKPQMTFRDSTVNYGSDAPSAADYNSENYVAASTAWLHEETDRSTVTMTGSAPTPDLTYTPDSTKLTEGKITSIEDIPVDVAVTLGEVNINQYTTFLHEACTGDCSWDESTLDGAPAFLLHVPTTTVAVSKTVEGNFADQAKSFDFTLAASNNGVSALPVITTGSEYNSGEGTFSLTHGQSISLTVPVGVSLTVTEAAYEDYETAYRIGAEGAAEAGNAAAIDALTEDGAQIFFTNAREVIPDTGVMLDSLPYVAILLVVAAGAAFLLLRRKHRRQD